MFTKIILLTTALAATTLADCPCYQSTTTVPNPTCTPWRGVCPAIICATPTATATAYVPPNFSILETECEKTDVPTVTKYKACTTDCKPITCPTATVTKTRGRGKQCCSAW